MNMTKLCLPAMGVIYCAVFAAPAFATPPPASTAAMEQLTRMAEYMSKLQNFRYDVRSGYDVIQPSGQKIEFLETRTVSISRPNHARADFQSGEGHGTLYYDGKSLTLYDAEDNVYATTETQGNIEAALTNASERLGLRIPLAMLLSPKLPDLLRARVSSADLVETATLNGKECAHVAARAREVDLQIWIRSGEQPVPERIVITYRKEQGMPQYWADFSNWEVLTSADTNTTSFKVPEGAERLDFRETTKKSSAAEASSSQEAK